MEKDGALAPTGSIYIIPNKFLIIFLCSYLNAGTGNPCAWHNKAKPRPRCLSYEDIFVSVEKEGALAPTGSIQVIYIRI